MQKKLLAVAVAGALTAPAVALAQSSVTVSGAINVWYETAGATGATNTVPATGGTVSTFDVKNRDRVQDGAGSNIRFTAVEDIGGGMQGFMQIESAVINQANQRNDAAGTPANGTSFTPQNAGGWATRNSGVGLRGQAWGEILLGIWDVHYNEQYAVDNQIIKGASHNSSLALLNTFGGIGGIAIGTRYSNVIRYQSPNWGGFDFKLAYVRPTDNAVPTTTSAAAPNVQEGTKNKAINFAPRWTNGPIFVGFSYLKDSDIAVNQLAAFSGTTITNTTTGAPIGAAGAGATIGSAGATNLAEVKSSRLSAGYTFPFGLKLGLVYDMSKLSLKSTGTGTAGFGSSEVKRNVWVLPVSFNTGAHTIFAVYAQADKLKGTIGGAGNTSIATSEVGVTAVGGTTAMGLEENSKAKFYSLGYQFDLSKRTNLHVSYSQIKNDKLASYDMFANGVGMNAGSFGADPRIINLGIRHAF